MKKSEYYNRQNFTRDTNVIIEYKNLEQFISDMSTKDYPRRSSEDHDKKWSGSESVETAIQEAREGLNLGEVDLGIIKHEQLHDYINRATYAVAGGSVDIGKFLTGEPECMIDFQTEDAVKFVTLSADITESAGCPNNVFKRKAIAIACLVDQLENNGFRVKLNVVLNENFVRSGWGRLVGIVTIKDYHQKLSIAQITGCVSQGFYRRLMFCFIEKYSITDPDDAAYGMPDGEFGSIPMTGVVLKNTRQGISMSDDSQIKEYVEKYTQEAYNLPQI